MNIEERERGSKAEEEFETQRRGVRREKRIRTTKSAGRNRQGITGEVDLMSSFLSELCVSAFQFFSGWLPAFFRGS
jgi:hypothetical protein